MNPKPTRIVPNMRPLYFHEGVLFCASFDKLFTTKDLGATFEFVGNFSSPGRLRFVLRACRLAQRVMRMVVYRLRVLSNGNIVFIFKGGLYTIAAGQSHAKLTCRVERGSRPVSLACKPGGPIVFGEYFSNPDRSEVHIFASYDFGMTWQKAYSFNPGQVRHIHGLTYDQWQDCFWIFTGDLDMENRLIQASCDFKTVRTVCQGGQENRFYSAVVDRDYLVAATDTPLQANSILIMNKNDESITRIPGLQNSSFYSCKVNDHFFISTNAEPSYVNDVKHSHIWMSLSRLDSWKSVLSFRTDLYNSISRLPGVPKGLFQYPRIFFPEGINNTNTLVCHGIGVKKYDNTMLCYDIPELLDACR